MKKRTIAAAAGLLLGMAHMGMAQNVWDGSAVSTITTNGKVGIGIANPASELHIKGALQLRNRVDINKTVFLGYNESGFAFLTSHDVGTNTPQNLTLNGRFVGVGTLNPQVKLHVVGTTRTDVLEITGGSDLSESFDIHGSGEIRPGMLVSIDPDRPGQLRVAASAYDRTVAGILSGAGGVNPGMVMGQKGSLADGEHPVALTGRVYALADTSAGPIQPGDLLTTSPRPGHAMKVTDHAKAQGAIIGKAMTPLADGQGLVLVLVSLQ
jgi:hypothetical protein